MKRSGSAADSVDDVRVPAAELAVRLAALSHPARLEILRHLSRRQCCCKDVVERLDLAQSTVSQHLKVLVEAGIVSLTSDRQRSLYRIDHAVLSDVSRSLAGLVAGCCGGAAGEFDATGLCAAPGPFEQAQEDRNG